jgi:hypothetical protein
MRTEGRLQRLARGFIHGVNACRAATFKGGPYSTGLKNIISRAGGNMGGSPGGAAA